MESVTVYQSHFLSSEWRLGNLNWDLLGVSVGDKKGELLVSGTTDRLAAVVREDI